MRFAFTVTGYLTFVKRILHSIKIEISLKYNLACPVNMVTAEQNFNALPSLGDYYVFAKSPLSVMHKIV